MRVQLGEAVLVEEPLQRTHTAHGYASMLFVVRDSFKVGSISDTPVTSREAQVWYCSLYSPAEA